MKGVDEKIFPSKSLHTSYFQEHSSKRLTSEKPVSRSLSLIVGMKEPTTVRRILEEQCKPSNMRGEVWEGVGECECSSDFPDGDKESPREEVFPPVGVRMTKLQKQCLDD